MTPSSSTMSKGKKHLDIERLKGNMSQHGSSTCNSQFDSDEYNFEEQKMTIALGEIDQDNQVDENDGDGFSTLKMPLSKYKMQGDEASKGQFMKLRNSRDFSPITPNRAAVIRTGMTKDASLLNSPKVSLPTINSPASGKNGGANANAQKSTFSKKKDNSTFGSAATTYGSTLTVGGAGPKGQPMSGTSPKTSFSSSLVSGEVPAYQQEILENFGHRKNKYLFFEGECFLKTKTDRYKQHWAMVMGNELYCYRRKGDSDHRAMHCLVGTFIKELPQEANGDGHLWPIKSTLPPNKSRVLYFSTEQDQKKWGETFKEAIGYANLFDFYDVKSTLGKGQFGLVQLSVHKKTALKVAIKTVKKKDMKAIEVY